MERLSRIMHWKTQQKMSATLSLRPAHHLYTRLMQDCLLRSRPSETIQVGSKAAIISQRLPLRKVIALGILELFDAAGQSFHNFRDVVTRQAEGCSPETSEISLSGLRLVCGHLRSIARIFLLTVAQKLKSKGFMSGDRFGKSKDVMPASFLAATPLADLYPAGSLSSRTRQGPRTSGYSLARHRCNGLEYM